MLLVATFSLLILDVVWFLAVVLLVDDRSGSYFWFLVSMGSPPSGALDGGTLSSSKFVPQNWW